MTAQTNQYQNHVQTQDNLQFLRRTVQADGLFCTVVGTGIAVGAGPIAGFLGLAGSVAPWVGGLIGAGTALYGLEVMYLATTERFVSLPRLASMTIGGNILWILASLALLFTSWVTFTTGGWWSIAILADIVAVFAAVQYYALRKLNQA